MRALTLDQLTAGEPFPREIARADATGHAVFRAWAESVRRQNIREIIDVGKLRLSVRSAFMMNRRSAGGSVYWRASRATGSGRAGGNADKLAMPWR